MLKMIEEFNKCVAIAGFKNAKIENAEKFLRTIQKKKESGMEIQFFDAQIVATWQHLYFAALNALTSFKNRENRAKSLAMETMLYASAQRQIRKATEILGIKPTSTEIAALLIGDKPEIVQTTLKMIQRSIDAQFDDSVLEISSEKAARIKEAFRITDKELETVAKKKDELEKSLISLVIEHMALLATQR
ncbi:MAG TPA: KEOPS complex subunit Cgi121 [Candidatus Bathyarchaeia archaeon]|jgi:KEOPS complex subunit Cgi121|nr:KEOPS complex subunit Cgi121 [Candidatus Bathyarchaeia archaeon]